jgi:hypothetical protein
MVPYARAHVSIRSEAGVSTEVWFRNPDNYIRELVEVEVGNIVWDRGLLVKKSIDPDKHAGLYFGRAIPFRVLVVGTQGTAELDIDHSMSKPKAVYPTWAYGEEVELLEEMVERPVGNEERYCLDTSVPPDERPVWGQEHRVVITDLPLANTGQGRKFMRFLKELQEDHPECIIHVHGLYSFRVAFGMGYRAADIEARTVAQKGKIILPSGKEELYERAVQHPKWITQLGFKVSDMSVPRNRCMYNIKSALWAGEHYAELYKFRVVGQKGSTPDITSSELEYKPPETKSHMLKPRKPSEGDQFLCDTCSLQLDCKYFRDGAVCSVPGAEPTELARYFKTRDSDQIIDGLGTLMAAQTRRLERGLQEEEDFGLDPEVTKMMNQLFEQGVKLAKLLNPDLRGGAKIAINTGGGAAAVSMGNPKQFIASIIRELELQGVPRDKITPAMIQGMMSGMAQPAERQRAIEGEVVASEQEAV